MSQIPGLLSKKKTHTVSGVGLRKQSDQKTSWVTGSEFGTVSLSSVSASQDILLAPLRLDTDWCRPVSVGEAHEAC